MPKDTVTLDQATYDWLRRRFNIRPLGVRQMPDGTRRYTLSDRLGIIKAYLRHAGKGTK